MKVDSYSVRKDYIVSTVRCLGTKTKSSNLAMVSFMVPEFRSETARVRVLKAQQVVLRLRIKKIETRARVSYKSKKKLSLTEYLLYVEYPSLSRDLGK